jgi:hypothetical protein
MSNTIKTYKSVKEPFFMESVESGTDTSKLEYHGRGESVYSDGRQVLVRSCHDALVSYNGEKGEGILLIRRKGEPARGYLWPLGGFFGRGVSSEKSLVSRIKHESGLDVDEDSLTVLGHIRAMWNTTPNKEAEEKGLPLGIDDTGVLYFGEGHGKLNLNRLHENPLIVTPKMYTDSFRETLHPYVQLGMDRAIEIIK